MANRFLIPDRYCDKIDPHTLSRLSTTSRNPDRYCDKIDHLTLSRLSTTSRNHFFASDGYIYENTKGTGYRKVALNASLTSIISEYLAERNDDQPALFLNNQNRAISKSWVQRLVKTAGQDAGLTVALNCNIRGDPRPRDIRFEVVVT